MKELLVDKVAIITGSGRGIGKEMAELFCEQGAKVVISDIDQAPMEETVKELTTKGYNAIGFTVDVTKKEPVQKMVQDTIAKWGKIDILVNNAGFTRDALIHKMEDKLLRLIIDINLKGTHLCTQAVLPEFLKPERKDEFKKIINFASSTGVTGNIGQANYAMAKGGIIAYTKSCAREFAQDRVCINAIAPAFTETRMTALKKPGDILGMPAGIRSTAINATPFARNQVGGQPVDVARIALFFSSELSNWVTGQILLSDGGMMI